MKLNKIIYIKIISVFILLFAIWGCKQSTEVEVDLPTEQYLVVRADLRAGEDFEGVLIHKTLPLNQDFNMSEAEITNAIVYLKINNVQFVPLHYQSNGVYNTKYSFKIEAGKKYELFVESELSNAYANTFVPEQPMISNVLYNQEHYLETNYAADTKYSYAAKWYLGASDQAHQADDFYDVNIVENENVINIRTMNFPEFYQSSSYKSKLYMKVFAFDKPFYDFFNSRDNNKPLTDEFVQSGGNVAWNVEGNKAIGLFIGYTESSFVRVGG